jgi:hypothetical protein
LQKDKTFLVLLFKIPEANRAYVDECGVKKDLVREYGYAPKENVSKIPGADEVFIV